MHQKDGLEILSYLYIFAFEENTAYSYSEIKFEH
jgi:hypothetical protein